MSQTWTVDSINTASTSPAEAWPMAIDAFNALRTGFSGTSRPTDIAAGQTWIDTDYASGVWAVYRVVTASPALDALVGTIDAVTGQFVPANGLASATVTPSSDADVTLTAAQYAAGVLILADGSWTATHNIIVPAYPRFYFVDNSAGTYAATVKTAAGTGIQIPAGSSARVYCNGTNVLLNGSLTTKGTPSVTAVSNLDAVTAGAAMAIRTGNIVTQSGSFQADPTTAGSIASMRIALLIPSNFSSISDCCGSGAETSSFCRISGDTTNDAALVEFIAGVATNRVWYYSFTYEVK